MSKKETHDYSAAINRILLVSECRTQQELAELLGIRQSLISNAYRRKNIPAKWLLKLFTLKSINPDWVLTGRGPAFVTLPSTTLRYETGDEAAEREALEESVRCIPSRMLADELVRRIAASQTDKLSKNGKEE